MLQFDNLNDLKESLFDPEEIAESNEKFLMKHITSHFQQIDIITESFRTLDWSQYRVIIGILDKLCDMVKTKQIFVSIVNFFLDFLNEQIQEENFSSLRKLA